MQLMGGPFVIADGHRMPVPEGSKRLVAFVALSGRHVERFHAAFTLWPEVERARAAGNLRSAMWRLRCAGIDILEADTCGLAFHDDVHVDLDAVTAWAQRIVNGRARGSDVAFRPSVLAALDLLPGWYDDWVLRERERIRRCLLDAIEALAQLLVELGRCGEAIEAALAAISIDPLRESAQRALIAAHLAEGNRCEALRSYAIYEELMAREFGAYPAVGVRRLLTTR